MAPSDVTIYRAWMINECVLPFIHSSEFNAIPSCIQLHSTVVLGSLWRPQQRKRERERERERNPNREGEREREHIPAVNDEI